MKGGTNTDNIFEQVIWTHPHSNVGFINISMFQSCCHFIAKWHFHKFIVTYDFLEDWDTVCENIYIENKV